MRQLDKSPKVPRWRGSGCHVAVSFGSRSPYGEYIAEKQIKSKVSTLQSLAVVGMARLKSSGKEAVVVKPRPQTLLYTMIR
jgi:hypothetical protein